MGIIAAKVGGLVRQHKTSPQCAVKCVNAGHRFLPLIYDYHYRTSILLVVQIELPRHLILQYMGTDVLIELLIVENSNDGMVDVELINHEEFLCWSIVGLFTPLI